MISTSLKPKTENAGAIGAIIDSVTRVRCETGETLNVISCFGMKPYRMLD